MAKNPGLNARAKLHPDTVRCLISLSKNDFDTSLTDLMADNAFFENLIELSRLNGVDHIVCANLNRNPRLLTEEQRRVIRDKIHHIVFRDVSYEQEIKKANALLADSGLKYCFIKGVDLMLNYYEDTYLRRISDLDIMFPQKQMLDVEDIFVKDSYSLPGSGLRSRWFWRHFTHHMGFSKTDGLLVEAHWSVLMPNKPVVFDVEQMMSRLHIRKTKYGEIPFLCPEDALVVACVNMSLGDLFHNTPIKHMLDINAILEKTGDDFEWDIVLENHPSLYPFILQPLILSEAIFGKGCPKKHLQKLTSESKKRHLDFVQDYNVEDIIKNARPGYDIRDYLTDLRLCKDVTSFAKLIIRPAAGFICRL